MKMIAANSDDLNLIPRNLHGRRINSQKLSSNFHIYAVIHVYPLHTKINAINTFKSIITKCLEYGHSSNIYLTNFEDVNLKDQEQQTKFYH